MEMQPGDAVWVEAGPYAGFDGRVIQIDVGGTAHVVLDVFGRPTPVELRLGPPDSGLSGVREPRGPIPTSGPAAMAAPMPDD